MNILQRQQQQINNAILLAEDYEPLLDSEGRAVMANLPDGTRLRWRNLLNYTQGINQFTFTKESNGFFSINIEGSKEPSVQQFAMIVATSIKTIANHNYIAYAEWQFGQGVFDSSIEIQAQNANNRKYFSKGDYCYYPLGETCVGKTGKGFDYISCISDYTLNFRHNFYPSNTNTDDIVLRTYPPVVFDLTDMLGDLAPKSAAEFKAMFPNLGHVPYTDEPIECIVYKGILRKMPQQ